MVVGTYSSTIPVEDRSTSDSPPTSNGKVTNSKICRFMLPHLACTRQTDGRIKWKPMSNNGRLTVEKEEEYLIGNIPRLL